MAIIHFPDCLPKLPPALPLTSAYLAFGPQRTISGLVNDTDRVMSVLAEIPENLVLDHTQLLAIIGRLRRLKHNPVYDRLLLYALLAHLSGFRFGLGTEVSFRVLSAGMYRARWQMLSNNDWVPLCPLGRTGAQVSSIFSLPRCIVPDARAGRIPTCRWSFAGLRSAYLAPAAFGSGPGGA